MIADPKTMSDPDENPGIASEVPEDDLQLEKQIASASSGNSKGKPGRKNWIKANNDQPLEQAIQYGTLGLSAQNIASLWGVSKKTVEREFQRGEEKSEFVRRYRLGETKRHRGLRVQLYKRAVRSDRVLMFLAKNDLGMQDKPPIQIDQANITIQEEEKPLPEWMKRSGTVR